MVIVGEKINTSLKGITEAIKEKNKGKMEMLFLDWLGLKKYVWSKI